MNNKKEGIKIYEFCFFGAVLVILILISISILSLNIAYIIPTFISTFNILTNFFKKYNITLQPLFS